MSAKSFRERTPSRVQQEESWAMKCEWAVVAAGGLSLVLLSTIGCRSKPAPPKRPGTIHEAAERGDKAAVERFRVSGTDT